LRHREEVLSFIKKNPEELTVTELSRLSEIVNNSRVDTAAYYTDEILLNEIGENLPDIEKKTIRILEPSVGTGNFIQLIVNKYRDAERLIIDVNDIDEKSIEIAKLLNQLRDIPRNIEINYFVEDFLNPFFFRKYDLVVGNPPFSKLSNNTGLADYAQTFSDNVTKNLSAFFLQKAVEMGDKVVMILPKYFLSSDEFSLTRNRISQYRIDKILDFGEKGFKGVLIETIAIFMDTQKKPEKTISYSITFDIRNEQSQKKLTHSEFNSWLIYRDSFFDEIAGKMKFGIFKVFRDRQLTNSILKDKGDVRVLKSRNISRDGKSFLEIAGYDAFVDRKQVAKFSVSKYFERDDVYLAPNMTYYPRVIKKPKNTLVNGSVAILENISGQKIKKEQLEFLSGSVFEKFYRIARNYSTRSLNIDNNSVQFFGLYEGESE